MIEIPDFTPGQCSLCNGKSVKIKEGFEFCQECFDEIEGKLLLMCYSCHAYYGVLENNEHNIARICRLNAKKGDYINEIVFNLLYNTAIITQATIFPTKGCSVCKGEDNGKTICSVQQVPAS